VQFNGAEAGVSAGVQSSADSGGGLFEATGSHVAIDALTLEYIVNNTDSPNNASNNIGKG